MLAVTFRRQRRHSQVRVVRNHPLMSLLVVLAIGSVVHSARAASYIGAEPSCAATASVLGNDFTIILALDRAGLPADQSYVSYNPAGTRPGLYLAINRSLRSDKKVSSISQILATGIVDRRDVPGSFTLKIEAMTFKSPSVNTSLPQGAVRMGTADLNGRAEFTYSFNATKSLVDALADGGPGELTYFDGTGRSVLTATLSFMTISVIQGVVDKAYPAALRLAKNRDLC